MVDTSVCRARLEPSSAVTVHHQLGLPTSCINFDIVNACLGFVNAMQLAGAMIESGQIEYALIVDGEGTREIYDNTINFLNEQGEGLADIVANFASLTLGSGSAAMVLGKHSANPGSHRVLRGFFRAATQHHELCVGSLEKMTTDTRALLDAGTELAKLAWDDAGSGDEWGGRDRYIFHQVSEVHTNAMLGVLGVDPDKVPKTFPNYGNIGPAAIPITLAAVTDTLSARRSRAVHGHRLRPQRRRHRTPVVTAPHTARAARTPPPGLAGLDPAWSRLVRVPRTDGVGRTWHVLDNGVADAHAHVAVRARQPVVVVPVPRPGRASARRACG